MLPTAMDSHKIRSTIQITSSYCTICIIILHCYQLAGLTSKCTSMEPDSHTNTDSHVSKWPLMLPNSSSQQTLNLPLSTPQHTTIPTT
jgi:hypothetical protein